MLLYLHHRNSNPYFHPAKFDNFKDKKRLWGTFVLSMPDGWSEPLFVPYELFKWFQTIPKGAQRCFWVLVKIWEPQGPPHGAPMEPPPPPPGAPSPPSRGLPLKIRSGTPAYLLWLRGASHVFDCGKNLGTHGAPHRAQDPKTSLGTSRNSLKSFA